MFISLMKNSLVSVSIVPDKSTTFNVDNVRICKIAVSNFAFLNFQFSQSSVKIIVNRNIHIFLVLNRAYYIIESNLI